MFHNRCGVNVRNAENSGNWELCTPPPGARLNYACSAHPGGRVRGGRGVGSSGVGGAADTPYPHRFQAAPSGASLQSVCVRAVSCRGASRPATSPAAWRRPNNACGNSSPPWPTGERAPPPEVARHKKMMRGGRCNEAPAPGLHGHGLIDAGEERKEWLQVEGGESEWERRNRGNGKDTEKERGEERKEERTLED